MQCHRTVMYALYILGKDGRSMEVVVIPLPSYKEPPLQQGIMHYSVCILYNIQPFMKIK